MTYNCENNEVAPLPRGRKQLVDYSKFKANVPSTGTNTTNTRNPRSVRPSRSRSNSRGRNSFVLHDDPYTLERLHQIEIQADDDANNHNNNNDESVGSFGYDYDDEEEDLRMTQSERIPSSRTYQDSDGSLGLLDLEDDEEDEDIGHDTKAKANQSMPMVGLENGSFFLKREKSRNASSLSSFGEGQPTGPIKPKPTTEEQRSDLNRILLSNRRRSRSNGATKRPTNHNSFTETTTTALPGLQRSKSLGPDAVAAYRATMSNTPAAADPPAQGSKHLRRFRRHRRSSMATTDADSTSTSTANSTWHNSTGQLSLDDAASIKKQQRRPVRRSMSTTGSTVLDAAPGKRSLPARSKTISYTTTHGKNSNEQSLGTSNHGFLTGSRIKRIIPNNDD